MGKVEIDEKDKQSYEIFAAIMPDDFSDITPEGVQERMKEFLEKKTKENESKYGFDYKKNVQPVAKEGTEPTPAELPKDNEPKSSSDENHMFAEGEIVAFDVYKDGESEPEELFGKIERSRIAWIVENNEEVKKLVYDIRTEDDKLYEKILAKNVFEVEPIEEDEAAVEQMSTEDVKPAEVKEVTTTDNEEATVEYEDLPEEEVDFIVTTTDEAATVDYEEAVAEPEEDGTRVATEDEINDLIDTALTEGLGDTEVSEEQSTETEEVRPASTEEINDLINVALTEGLGETPEETSEEAVETEEVRKASEEEINDLINAALTEGLGDEPLKETDEEIDALIENIPEDPESKRMEEIKEKVESGELSSEGEYMTASVAVNTATGERQIVSTDAEFNPDNTSMDDLMENPDIDHSDVKLEDEALQKAAAAKFGNLSTKDLQIFLDAVKIYKEESEHHSLIEFFNMLPDTLRNGFDENAIKLGVPLNNLNSYRKNFVKGLMEEFISDAEMEQATVDFDKQIAKIYQDYGNDVALLYQSNIFEKIKTTQTRIDDLKANNTDGANDEKIANFEKVVENLYESIYLEKFAPYAMSAKIKPFEMEKPQKLFRDFTAKYESSKFMISDIKNTIPVLINFCGYSEEEALELVILFCKYTKNMKPSNLADHTFMYYFISNIITLAGKAQMDVEGEEPDRFVTILKSNLIAIRMGRVEVQKRRAAGQEVDIEYESKKIDQAYMDSIIIKAEEKAKEMEEEAEQFEEEFADEEDSTDTTGSTESTEASETVESTSED